MTQYIDELTSLNNALYLKEQYKEYIKKDGTTYLIAIDFRSLKYINDNFGHKVGDMCLILFSQIVTKRFSDSLLIRLHGDEFVIVTNDNPEGISDKIIAVYNDIKNDYEKEQIPVMFTFNSGIVLAKENLDEMLLKADLTMYEAKKKENLIEYYNDQIYKKFTDTKNFIHSVDEMLDKNEFKYAYRPLYDINGNNENIIDLTIVDEHEKNLFSDGHYDVLRINHKLKKIDMINLKRCLEEIIPNDKEKEYIVNVSYQTIVAKEHDIVGELQTAINKNMIVPNKLCINIDTQYYQGSTGEIVKIISDIKKTGIKVGIGEMSLESQQFIIPILSLVDIDYIKISKSMLEKAKTDQRIKLVLTEFINLCQKLGVITIFTNIDNEEQLFISNLNNKVLIRKK